MPGFMRRFSKMPDTATIRKVDGVIMVDSPPAGKITGANAGTVCAVGECEDGGFAVDSTVAPDAYHPAGGLLDIFNGNLGAVVGSFGFTFNTQKSQFPCARRSVGEWWNGNLFVQLSELAFKRLMIARVDTSLGSVTFSPLAYAESGTAGPWALTTGQTIVHSYDGAADVTATFTGVAAIVTGSGAAFGSLTAGEYVDLSMDSGATVRTTFQSGDDTIAEVVSRINAAFGSTVASNSAGQLRLTSATIGTAGRIVVVGGSTGTLTDLGLTAATTSGTGNVANIGAVTAAEVKTIVEALTGSPKVRTTASGKVRLCSATGVTGTVRIQDSSTATAFGFTTETDYTATSGTKFTSIPAGTLVSAGTSASRVVTMQTLSVPASTAIGITVKVRAALDDGTYAGATANTLTTIETTPSDTSEWTVNNPSAVSAALSEAAKDAAYEAAIAATKSLNSPQRLINYIGSARQSERLRAVLKQNALDASAFGGNGRKAVLAPPTGTSLATMITSSSPGVGATRDERVFYAPGWRKVISPIAALGATLGGGGFTDSGEVNVHGDFPLISLCSLLNPEENPAQDTDFLPTSYVGVDSALSSWGMDEYGQAKEYGICAPIWDEDEGPGYHGGVTSVSSSTYPTQVPMTRVKLADFLTDSIAVFQKPYVAKLKSESLKNMLFAKIHEFLDDLKEQERIAKFSVELPDLDIKRALVIDWSVDPLDSADSIVNRTSIGEGAVSTSRVA